MGGRSRLCMPPGGNETFQRAWKCPACMQRQKVSKPVRTVKRGSEAGGSSVADGNERCRQPGDRCLQRNAVAVLVRGFKSVAQESCPRPAPQQVLSAPATFLLDSHNRSPQLHKRPCIPADRKDHGCRLTYARTSLMSALLTSCSVTRRPDNCNSSPNTATPGSE